MPIFQKSIVDKYLDTLDAGVLDKAYDSYKEVYSTQKIQRIKKLKEEQYQGGFLKDIFGSVLGLSYRHFISKQIFKYPSKDICSS